MGRMQASGGNVMLRAVFCWKNFGPGIHVDVTLTHITYHEIVADPDDSVLSPCHTIVLEWFKALHQLPNFPYLNPNEHLWDVLEEKNLIHGGPTSQHYTTGIIQRSYGVLVFQSCLSSMRGPASYLTGGFNAVADQVYIANIKSIVKKSVSL